MDEKSKHERIREVAPEMLRALRAVASETAQRIKRWIDAERRLERAKDELESASSELDNVTNDLGRYLAPEDAAPGEVFNIWYGDGLVQVQKLASGYYSVSWRKKPKPEFLR